jgi:hypothetical protein
MKNSKNNIYEVEIKSMAIIREGQKSLITYFKGGPVKRIISNLQILYPQYTHPEDKPNIRVTKITYSEFQERLNGKVIEQKAHLIEGETNI